MVLTPFTLGIILTFLVSGVNGLKELFFRMGKWKVGLRWYAAPLIFPVLILATLVPLAALVSAEFQPNFFFPGLLMGLLAGFFEETGWVGFAYPRMKTSYSALGASLILGVLHVVWHFAANYFTASAFRGVYFVPQFVAFCISMVAMRVILCWVYVNTESLLMAQLTHASSSGFLAILVPISLSPANDTIFYYVYSALLWTAALTIAAKYGKDLLAGQLTDRHSLLDRKELLTR
jgi:membrane protease YdiL (CAAX protease family)